MMTADCLTKTMSGRKLLGELKDRMPRQIDLTSDYSIKAVSLYGPVAYLDKELDEKYDYGDLSKIGQDQWSSDQSDTDDM